MQKVLSLVLVLTLLLMPTPAAAQGDVQLDSVLVQLWPEYDQPEMLVMVQYTLAQATSLPQDLSFRLPASATVHVVAVGQTHNTVTDQGINYETRPEDGWQVLTIKDVGGPAIWIEYYDTLEIQGSARHYHYEWPGDYATLSLGILFQQPVDATDLVIDPLPISSSTDENGLLYLQVKFPPLAVGNTAVLDADYQKDTDRLSASLSAGEPVEPPEADAPASIPTQDLSFWLGGAGFLLIIVGVILGLYFQRRKIRGSQRRHHQSSGTRRKNRTLSSRCPSCGNVLQPGDRFCRACGRSQSSK